jgi:SfnB family sulfur acquisition oxidoreductase
VSRVAGPVAAPDVPEDVRVLGSGAEALRAAAAYADAIRGGAVARDRDRRLPHAELEELARTGLLGMRIAASHGGAGVSSATVAEVFRLVSAADPAIGQIPQNHIQFTDTIIRYGTPAQQALFLPQVLAGARLGNALSERGGRTARDWVTRLTRGPDGLRLSGRKYYSTGALTAQWIPVFAFDDDEQVVMAYVPRAAPGVSVDQDWTAFGQRGTFSGTTVLDDVHVADEWVVRIAEVAAGPSTYSAFGQLMHAAVDVGIARGALDDGAAFLRERARPPRESGLGRAADDPQLLLLVGQLDTQVRAAEALLGAAGAALDRADAVPGDPGLVTEGRMAVAAAKAFGGETALRVATEIFDVSGSSAADEQHGLDRHWRNARTHTLHDPARSKHVHLGRYLVDGLAPPAGEALI